MAATLAVLLTLAAASPAAAQTSFMVSNECAAPYTAYQKLIDQLLQASLYGEAAYDKLRSEKLDAATNDALSACRADAPAKRSIYDINGQLRDYQSTRDAALRILQAKPPAPVN
ncbi:MAG: hypothetical protein GC166_00630 [Alphaproteobacteria bacterium]|nr:hypothetical protein [Alphaproteobacteria bacterium]